MEGRAFQASRARLTAAGVRSARSGWGGALRGEPRALNGGWRKIRAIGMGSRVRTLALAVTAAALAADALVGVRAAAGPLTERPMTVPLTNPAIGYYTRPTTDVVAGLN